MARRRFFSEVIAATQAELTADQVRTVEKRLNIVASGDARFGWLVGTFVVAMILIGYIFSEGLMQGAIALGLPYAAAMTIRIIGTPLLLIGVWFALMPRIIRPRIRRAMRDCGLNICARCGYELKGLPPDSVCPECGAEDQPPLGSWTEEDDKS
ncbi:MAG: hypothetical protein KC983_09875 [Phycisphaerales bacterium]|nr:hypothetical protein [Phycisphaerales bacterium]